MNECDPSLPWSDLKSKALILRKRNKCEFQVNKINTDFKGVFFTYKASFQINGNDKCYN